MLLLALMLVPACAGGASQDTTGPAGEDNMDLTSVFEDQQPIPPVFTCDGEDQSPPLEVSDLPEGTHTLVLVMEDPDAPSGTFDHWVAFDIAPVNDIPEGTDQLGVAGRNSSGGLGYRGPCPPSGTHRYFIRVYALDTELGLPEGATKQEVLAAADGHVLGQGTLMGTYRR